MPEPSGEARSDRRTRAIAMLNQKGGVGKTTSTVNLGAALAREGLRVCLIDLDPQGHLTYHLGIDEETINHTVYDLLIDASIPVEGRRHQAGETPARRHSRRGRPRRRRVPNSTTGRTASTSSPADSPR